MQQFRDVLHSRLQHLSQKDQEIVLQALDRAVEWHDGQFRESGEPYVTHPIAVTEYLAQLEVERDTLVAALLHDVIEDSRVTQAMIEREFGPVVAKLVEGVTKLSKLQYEGDRTDRQVASLRKMLLVASEDLRVILIKLADRWHNVQTLGSLRLEKQQRVAHETLDIYVPFARIVGLWDLKQEFEEVCFPIAFPAESEQWKKRISEVRARLQPQRDEFVRAINAVTATEVTPRITFMTDYELFQKLFGDVHGLEKSHSIDSVLLIISGSSKEADCYRVLGEIHVRYPVSTHAFRDYINAPLPNGYRALHTTMFLARDHELRLRIQTQEMYEYVTKRKISSWITQKDNDIYTALAALHKPAYDKEQYLTDLRQTVLERINVFTTAGEIVRLPGGATGIDFAFSVNPDAVASLGGIRVNGEMRVATHELHDGDTVELILLPRAEQEQHRLLWLQNAKSADARQTVREELRKQPAEQQTEEGRKALEREAQKRRLPLWSLFRWSAVQQQLVHVLKEESFDTLMRKVGSGEVAVTTVIDAYHALLVQSPPMLYRLLAFLHLLPRSRVLSKESSLIDVDVYAEDRQGLIYDITRCIAERKINIAKFSVYAVPPHDALYQIRLEVPEFKEFSKLYDALQQVPSVKSVLRKR